MDVERSGAGDQAAMCVLASGSAGNCTVLAYGTGRERRLCMIDAGLSPRRTLRLLRDMGLSLDQLDAVVLTHLDGDHWKIGWGGLLPERTSLHLHREHFREGTRLEIIPRSASAFDGPFEVFPGVVAHPALLAHDAQGVASYRFEFPGGGRIGFATDVGRVTPELTSHLRGVGVLAIESNYCRRMQLASSRPWPLKARIMGGSGHLSNDEAAAAVETIAPRHVVFLHLSRECNRPEVVADLHAGGEYEFTIADQHRPTRWIPVTGGVPVPRVVVRPGTLWSAGS